MQLTPQRLQRIPHAPGVYTFTQHQLVKRRGAGFTRRSIPIYVGKAADLRVRLGAYRTDAALPHTSPLLTREVEKEGVGRQRSNERPWIPLMVREATGLRIEQTNSELEALLLEANRITVFRPKYNIANRDQKSFLSILVTTDEEFPQMLATCSHARAGTYFGPFTSAHAVRETLRALRKIFPFRCSRRPVPPELPASSHQPQALLPLSLPLHRGRGEKNSFPTSHREGGRGGVGRALRPCLYFHLGQCAGTCSGLVTAAEYRRRVIAPLLRILRGQAKSARKMLDEEHRCLLDDVLAHTRVLSVTEKYAADLHDLQRVLHLPSLPARIEGYDISNIHGLEAVGSMVVAIDGEPAPSEYKRFKIKTLEGRSNDVGMLREVLARRLNHSVRCKVSGVRCSEPWPIPDLMLIDGGKAQLNAALEVFRTAGVDIANSNPNLQMHPNAPNTPNSDFSDHSDGIRNIRIAIVALAKREEEVYLPGERAPLHLPRNSPALHLLQRVRDEAHRFAISFHRMRYRKRMFRG